MNTNNRERLESLFANVLSLYERFVKHVSEEIMEPFFQGDFEIVKENLSKFSNKMSVDRLFSMVICHFRSIVNFRRDLDKHYHAEVSEQDEPKIETEVLNQKLSSLLGDLRKLQKF